MWDRGKSDLRRLVYSDPPYFKGSFIRLLNLGQEGKKLLFVLSETRKLEGNEHPGCGGVN